MAAARNLRFAAALNLMLPGAGLFYLGRRLIGGLLAGIFLCCFVALLGVFLVGYARYLTIAMSSDLMKEGELEKAAAAFHTDWLIGFGVVGFVIYLCSAVLFWRVKRGLAKDAPC